MDLLLHPSALAACFLILLFVFHSSSNSAQGDPRSYKRLGYFIMTYCTIWIGEQHLQHTEVNNGYLDFFLTHIMIHKNYVHGFTKKQTCTLCYIKGLPYRAFCYVQHDREVFSINLRLGILSMMKFNFKTYLCAV